MKRVILAIVAVLALASSAAAQTTIKNPTAIAFTSADHDNPAVTGYEVDIITTTATPTVVQTIAIAKASTTKLATGEIKVTLNVQPIAFGSYRFVARTVAGTLKSDNSVPSDTWDRAPGAPSKPTPQ